MPLEDVVKAFQAQDVGRTGVVSRAFLLGVIQKLLPDVPVRAVNGLVCAACGEECAEVKYAQFLAYLFGEIAGAVPVTPLAELEAAPLPSQAPPPRAPELSGIELQRLTELVKDNRAWLEASFLCSFTGRLTRPTMHDVVRELVKPATRELQCSYAELFDEVKAEVFVSHWWGEEFLSFVAALRKFADFYVQKCADFDVREEAPDRHPLTVTFWVCSFANRQWTVSLGDTLAASPFEKALSADWCRAVVMVMDGHASPLRRIWCIYEVLRCHMLSKLFHVATENGVLTDVSTEPQGERREDLLSLAFQVLTLDAAAAEASVESDRRMILDAIDEHVGGDQFTLAVQSIFAHVLRKHGKAIAMHDPDFMMKMMRCYMEAKLVVAWSGRTPLHQAAQSGSSASVRDALQKYAGDVAAANSIGQTPLHLAAMYNPDPCAVALLLEARCDSSARDSNRLAPLTSAAKFGQLHNLKALLQVGAVLDRDDGDTGTWAWKMASAEGHLAIMRELIRWRVDPATESNAGVAFFATQGETDKLETCITELKVDPNRLAEVSARTYIPLVACAANAGHLETVKMLHRHKADLTVQAKGDNEDVNGMTVMTTAVNRGSVELVDWLIAQRGDVHHRRADGVSPVFLAAGAGHTALVLRLLEARADVHQRAPEGILNESTLLHHAAIWGRLETVRELVRLRCDVNAVDDRGETPLHNGAYFGYEEVISFLVTAHADLNLVSEEGERPMDVALRKENTSAATLLTQLQRGKEDE